MGNAQNVKIQHIICQQEFRFISKYLPIISNPTIYKRDCKHEKKIDYL